MALKISSQIVKYEVISNKPEIPDSSEPNTRGMLGSSLNETVKRPDKLEGKTYKLSSPVYDHALYITINDIFLGDKRTPFEVFINSKNLEQYQWIVALTRVMSAVFRKGGDVTFLVEELKAVFDPKGGYWQKGKYIPSLIAEIGGVIETHLMDIGLIEKKEVKTPAIKGGLCSKCHEMAVAMIEGCATCMSCGDSKCG